MGDSTSKKQDKIVLNIQHNDERILKQLYHNVYPRAKNYVLKNNGNEDQAKDVFQEAFIACWRNIKDDKIHFNSNIEAYLFTITKNKWTDYLRSSKFKKTFSLNTKVEFEQTDQLEPDQAHDENNRSVMLEALKQLGETCRELLSLYYFDRLSMKKIAFHFSIDDASARNKKYRCMQQLRSIALKIKNNGRV